VIKLNKPTLRFPEFKDEWNVNKLENLIIQVIDFRGKTPKKIGMEWGGTIPALSAKNVEMGKINFTKETNYCSLELYNKWMNKGDCAFGDIIMTMEAPLGNIAQIPDNKKYILSQRVILLKVMEKNTSKDYLAHYLRSNYFQNQLKKYATGSTAQGIKQSNLIKVLIKLPTLVEQEKIDCFLSKVDEKIELLEKKLELWEKYKKGIMQQIFNQQIRFKDKNGQQYLDWLNLNFEEIFLTLPLSNYQIKSSEILPKGKIPVIDQGKDRIAGYSNNPSKICEDLPVIVYGDHTTTVKYSNYKFIVGGDGVKLLQTKIRADLKYLYYGLKFFNIGAEGYKRHFSILRTIKLPIPSISEQIKIANFLSCIDQKIELINKELEINKQFKKGLLQQMFC